MKIPKYYPCYFSETDDFSKRRFVTVKEWRKMTHFEKLCILQGSLVKNERGFFYTLPGIPTKWDNEKKVFTIIV